MYLFDREGLQECASISFDEPVAAVVQRFRDELDGGDSRLETGSTLFDALLGPVMATLGTTENLIVVPHCSLHYVPVGQCLVVPVGR